MITLGLDISTSCTGWCILSHDKDTKIHEMGYIDLSKFNTLYQKAKVVKDKIGKLHILHDINSVFIEENLQSFRSGFSSAQTLSKLAKFNGIVSYIAFEQFGIEPVFLNVNSARKNVGLKIIRASQGGAATKEQVFEWVRKDFPDFKWPKKVLKSGPRKGVEIFDPRCYDMADAYVIAMAGISC
jgi:Holliday junction resolvasome RuvABC endonuclease subunit